MATGDYETGIKASRDQLENLLLKYQSGPNNLENSRSRYLIREAGAYLAYITLGRRGIHVSDHLANSGLVRYVYDRFS